MKPYAIDSPTMTLHLRRAPVARALLVATSALLSGCVTRPVTEALSPGEREMALSFP
jgi:type IV pilus biogenesis protein CpaD/CtpE